MKITVLGGCGAWPTAGQACSGYLVEHDGFLLMLDPGYAILPRLLGHTSAERVDIELTARPRSLELRRSAQLGDHGRALGPKGEHPRSSPMDSGAHGSVNALAQEVRVPVMAAVFQEHVDHDHPQRDFLAPPRLIASRVQ